MILSNSLRRASKSSRQALTWAASALTLSVLAACGGGGADGGSSVVVDETAGWWATASKESNLQGAIYATTLPACDKVNGNIFALKSDVGLQGGPQNASANGLTPDTSFYVRVTNPAGNVLLGTSGSNTPITTDSTGRFSTCYALVDIVNRASNPSLPGFDDTPNSGNEYKVWISLSPDFTPNLSKTDNFKVAERDTPLPPVPTTGSVTVRKFYDANANGAKDASEAYLAGDADGWLVGITTNVGDQSGRTEKTFTNLPLLEISAWELKPDQSNWYATNVYVDSFSASDIVVNPVAGTFKMNTIGVTLTSSTPRTVEFGNVCTGDGGHAARTIGYWKNKGQEEITDAQLAALRAMNLRNEDGSNFDPATKAALKAWLDSARAVNMSYMLSAQLTAMKLNVMSGKVPAGAVIYAPAANSTTHVSGFASVQELMDAANAILATGDGTQNAADRQTMELLKNALDLGNNGQNFAQPTACARSFVNATAP